jgi:hypothetical protein
MSKRVNDSHKSSGFLPRGRGAEVFSRSAITNGRDLLPTIDGRSVWARRFRDLIQLHVSDLGGEDAVSTAELSLIRRGACLTVELERLEIAFAANGGATVQQLDSYQRAANTLRRLLQTIGMKRVPKDITPDLRSYLQDREAAE